MKVLAVGGEKVRVVQEVAVHWKDLAMALRFDYSLIKIIREDNKHDSCVEACEDMFHRWLEGEACQPVTWERLIEALKDIDQSTLGGTVHRLLH